MDIERWWPALSASTRDWLIANNGDALSPEVVGEIVQVGGPTITDAWWGDQSGPTGFYLPDDAIDWIEATANQE